MVNHYFIVLLLSIVAINATAQTCGPDLYFSNQAQVNDFASNYPGCVEVTGNIVINGSSIDSLNGLLQIEKIGGNLQVDNLNAVDFTGLNNLTEIGGFLYTNNIGIHTFDGLENLKKCAALYIQNNSQLTDLSGLIGLDTILVDLFIIGNPGLSFLTGLDSLKYLGGKININSNNALLSLHGLGGLSYIGTEFSIINNDGLLNLNGLNSLSSIDGELRIDDNMLLNDITGLINVQSINGPLYINWNASLTHLCGVDNIDYNTITTLSIVNNINLNFCDLDNICDYLNGSGYSTVFGNAPGCFDEANILSKCLMDNPICCDLMLDSLSIMDTDCIINDGTIEVFASCISCDTIEYSLDGTMWQTTNLFDSLSSGSYTVYIRDKLEVSCGSNQSNVMVNIENDNVQPVAICQSLLGYLDSLGYYYVNPSELDAGSTDNCGLDSLWTNIDSLTCSNFGDNTIELYVSDTSGNISSCNSTISIVDTIGPEMICLDTLLIFTDTLGYVQLDPLMVDNGSMDNCTPVTMSVMPVQFDCQQLGYQNVTLIASDNLGNSAECMSVVEVLDTISPNIVCKDITIDLNNTGVHVIEASIQNDALFMLVDSNITYSIYDAKAGDFDNDGDLDIVHSRSNSFQILFNDGDGHFTLNSEQNINYGFGGRTNVEVGDLDGDGDLDLFFSRACLSMWNSCYSLLLHNKVFFNNGDGTFTDSGQNLGNKRSRNSDLVDIDNDGDLDAVVNNYRQSNSESSVNIWINDGNGIFSAFPQNIDNYYCFNIEHGDIDGDGDIDLIFGNSSNPITFNRSNQIFLNDGSGYFINSGAEIGNASTIDVEVIDVDNDGDLDVYYTNEYNLTSSDRSNELYINDGSGGLTISGNFVAFDRSTFSNITADFNNDGNIDVFHNNSYSDYYWSTPSNGAIILLGDGNGGFSQTDTELPFLGSEDVIVADFNNDNNLDVYLINASQKRVSSHNGNLIYSSTSTFTNQVWLASPNNSVLSDLSDNCNDYDLTVSLSQDMFDINDLGTNIVTVSTMDPSGNSQLCFSQVTVTNCSCNPNVSPLIPNTSAGTTIADCKTVDGAFTHYCDAQGQLLLSIDSETAQSISPSDVSIMIQPGGLYYSQYCSNTSGGVHSGDCFISNSEGSVILCRTWDVVSTNTDAIIRYYFDQGDIDILNNEIYNQGLTPITSADQLWFYKVKNVNGHAKPQDLDSTDIVILDNSGTGIPSTTNWALGTFASGYFAEYQVASFSGGGGGIAHKGASAICPPIEANIEGDGLTDTLGLNSYVIIDIDGGIGPYDVILSSGVPYDSVFSGDTLFFGMNPLDSEVFIVSLVDSSGCPASELNSILPLFPPSPDTIPPVAICQDLLLNLDDLGMAFLDPGSVDNGSYDEDSLLYMVVNLDNFNCSDIGSLLVELTVFDKAGNSDSCNSTITIDDPLGACCKVDRSVHYLPGGFQQYFARNIISDAKLDASSNHDIIFQAQNGIELLPGFEVNQSALFEAIYGPCP